MKSFFLLILSFLVLQTQAQYARLVIKGSEGLSYGLIVNGMPYEKSDVANIRIDQLPSEKITLVFTFAKPAGLVKNFDFVSADSVVFVYNLTKKEGMDDYGFELYETVYLGEEVSLNGTYELFKYGRPIPYDSYQSSLQNREDKSSSVKMHRSPTSIETKDSLGTKTEVKKKEKHVSSSESSTTTSSVKTVRQADENGRIMPSEKKVVDCTEAWSRKEFEESMKQIEAATDDPQKMAVIKSAIFGHCVMASDVLAFISSLELESNRIDVGRSAYPNTFDKENYETIATGYQNAASYNAVSQYIDIKFK